MRKVSSNFNEKIFIQFSLSIIIITLLGIVILPSPLNIIFLVLGRFTGVLNNFSIFMYFMGLWFFSDFLWVKNTFSFLWFFSVLNYDIRIIINHTFKRSKKKVNDLFSHTISSALKNKYT